jgi:predicted nucleic acid-binding protein
MAIVVDASIAAAWCFPQEEGSSAADAVAMQIVGDIGIVPGIFWYEIRNVLVRVEVSGRIDREGTELFLQRLAQLQFQADHDQVEADTLALARRHRLTVYDAAYLETALRRGAALATLDTALAAATASEGVGNPAA